jgi:hypothetical protein
LKKEIDSGQLRWKVVRWERKELRNMIIYEGEAAQIPAREKISFHFTVRKDLLIADILAETTGGYRFVDYMKERLGDPGEEPTFIFHGEFGDGVPELPISAWWNVAQNVATSFIEDFIEGAGEVDETEKG